MREPTAIVFGSLEGSNTATSMSLRPGGNGVWKLIPLYTARTSIGCAPTEALSNVNCPCASVLELATGCMPPCNCSKMTSTPATAFPVVPFLTVPCNTPARAEIVPKSSVAQNERSLHRFVVSFRVFSGAKLEAQVAQIVIDGVASLHQLIQLRAMRREVGGVRLNVENKEQRRDGQRQASAQHRAIRGRNEQQRQQRRKKAAHQSSVSCATRRRACSNSSGEILAEDAPAICAAGAARF